jgi:hypothetical protein
MTADTAGQTIKTTAKKVTCSQTGQEELSPASVRITWMVGSAAPDFASGGGNAGTNDVDDSAGLHGSAGISVVAGTIEFLTSGSVGRGWRLSCVEAAQGSMHELWLSACGCLELVDGPVGET